MKLKYHSQGVPLIISSVFPTKILKLISLADNSLYMNNGMRFDKMSRFPASSIRKSFGYTNVSLSVATTP